MVRRTVSRGLRFVGLRRPSVDTASRPPAGLSDVQVLEWNRATCSWPNLYYSSTVPFLRAVSARRIAEVGVAYGYHASAILSGLPDAEYVGVDPYLAGYDASDIFASDVQRLFGDGAQRSMDRLAAAVADELAIAFPGRSRLIRVASVEAASSFPDEWFDAVFVDGDHRYEAVLQDLRAWWPKVRGGGAILGDDIQRDSVAQAWDEFLAETGADSFVLENSRSGYRTIVTVKVSSSRA
jgi:predicted O-methyltransferase YrrM